MPRIIDFTENIFWRFREKLMYFFNITIKNPENNKNQKYTSKSAEKFCRKKSQAKPKIVFVVNISKNLVALVALQICNFSKIPSGTSEKNHGEMS